MEPIFSDRGISTPEALDEAINRVTTVPSPYSPPPGLLCVEQTHNFGGGAVWTLEQLRARDCAARRRFSSASTFRTITPIFLNTQEILNRSLRTWALSARWLKIAPRESIETRWALILRM
ncbi:MAG: hypothetical protein EBE86_031320 [Hormoscilla sp. GUM202]|nr:hypothetical protein [Hormoscilla sp. GUM202]